jgi:HK97 family phage major capsid protein
MNKSLGEQVTDILMEKADRRRFAVKIDRKAGNVGAYPGTPETLPRVIPGTTQPYRVRYLCAPGTTVGSGIVYVRETSLTGTIVPIAPGGLKTQANMAWAVVNQPVTTIPAYLKIPAQYWEDFAMLQSWIDSRALYALAEAEENQLLNGDGTGSNLQGFMSVAITVSSVVGSGGAALLDSVATGIAALYARGYIATGIVVNPLDWGNVLAAKSVGGGYLLGDPGLITDPARLWGIPVVVAPAMAAGSYLVGQFTPYSQIFDRDDAAIEIADQNQDDFIRNMVTVRAEERLALAIYQSAAFAKGTFTS